MPLSGRRWRLLSLWMREGKGRGGVVRSFGKGVVFPKTKESHVFKGRKGKGRKKKEGGHANEGGDQLQEEYSSGISVGGHRILQSNRGGKKKRFARVLSKGKALSHIQSRRNRVGRIAYRSSRWRLRGKGGGPSEARDRGPNERRVNATFGKEDIIEKKEKRKRAEDIL